MRSLLAEETGSVDRPSRDAPRAEPEDVRLLIVEDDEDDYLITRDLLADQGKMRISVDWADTYEAALAAMRGQSHDVYLIDYRLGERTGLELIREAFASRPVAPVIMLTGQPVAEIDLEAAALGATDFFTKQQLHAAELGRSIRLALNHHKAERSALAARASDDGIWDWDLTAGVMYSSPRLSGILGLSEEALEVDPEDFLGLVAAEDATRLRTVIEAHLAGETPSLEGEFRMRHRDGHWLWVEVQGLASRDVNGTPIHMAGSLRDTTDRHVVQQRLEHEALHDMLTGLPNRTLFLDRVEQTLQGAARETSAGCALLFLDLDGFKQINDRLSHAVGDQLLIAFSERIAGAVRPGDTVARLGGDEFTVLLERLVEPAEATVIAERILYAMRAPFEIEGNELHVGVSIGISLNAEDQSPAELISAADVAMYDAKRQGRGRWSMFDERTRRRVSSRLARQDDLRDVIEQERLEVHFQPILALADRRLIGLEALARWPRDRTPVEPVEFIAIAEESGLIGALGEHVLRSALHALAGWRREGLADDSLWVSVNLSERQLSDAALVDQLRAGTADFDVPADRVRLELVESTLAVLERSGPLLSEIVQAGIGLHVDEFGTGYSSLTMLHRLPIRALKLPRELVAASGGRWVPPMTRSVVAVAHGLDAAAIGSGIETETQCELLAELGCDGGQGRLLAPVLEADRVAELLAGVRAG